MKGATEGYSIGDKESLQPSSTESLVGQLMPALVYLCKILCKGIGWPRAHISRPGLHDMKVTIRPSKNRT